MTGDGTDPQDEGLTRRVVTVLFCDLVGSTAIAEGLDAEDARDVMRSYHGAVSRVVQEHHGHLEKYIGDAVVAVFGLPRGRPDDAELALRAAVSARRAVEEINLAELVSEELSLSVRIGVNTAEVIAGHETSADALVGGDALNVAARLQQSAAPGEILISESTYEACASIAIAASVPAIRAKGRTEPVPARQLLDVLDVPGSALIGVDVPLVGREHELREMMSALERHASGSPTSIVLTGPPGAGKSRLAREFLARSGKRTAQARAKPASEAPEGAPLLGLLSRAGVSRPGLMSSADLSTDQVEEALTELGAVVDVAALDDAHLASHRLIAEMVASVGKGDYDAPLVLIVGRPDLSGALGDPADHVMRLELGPLSDGEVESLVRNVVAPSGIGSLAEIASAANGNPLYARELARSAAGTGRVEVPAGLRALISARIDEVSHAERELLQVAAIIGARQSEASLLSLASASGVESPDDALRKLRARQLLVPETNAAGEELAFESALIHEVVLGSLVGRERVRLHELRAESCEEPTVAAHHLLSAAEALSVSAAADARRVALAQKAAALLEMPHPPEAADARAGLSERVGAIVGEVEIPGNGGQGSTVTGPTLGGEASRADPLWKLRYRSGGGPDTVVELRPPRTPLVIGRNPDCALSLDWDEEVSRVHAELRWTGSGWKIVDCGSRNGTWVNGTRVPESLIADGDELRAGTVVFTAVRADPADPSLS